MITPIICGFGFLVGVELARWLSRPPINHMTGNLIDGSERRASVVPSPGRIRKETTEAPSDVAPPGAVRRGEILLLLNPNILRRV